MIFVQKFYEKERNSDMKKIIKLINCERKVLSVRSGKACNTGATDICGHTDSAECTFYAEDNCYKDYDSCTLWATDKCHIDIP